MNYEYPLVAINRDGTTRFFNDAGTFLSFAHDCSNGGVGGYWEESYFSWSLQKRDLRRTDALSDPWNRYLRATGNSWIVRDAHGRVVDKEKIVSPVQPKGKWAERRARRDADIIRAMENGRPIPGTGKDSKKVRKGYCRCWLCEGRPREKKEKAAHRYEDRMIDAGALDDL